MSLVEQLVQTHPWRTVGGAFLVGAGLAMDRRVRRPLVMSGLQIVLAIAVERIKQYALAFEAGARAYQEEEERATYARA
ncbi:MAG TPA: hypothetical protein VIV11_17730 [Kofleriaceae bacterium]